MKLTPAMKTVLSFAAAYAIAIAGNAFHLRELFLHGLLALRADDAWETKQALSRLGWQMASQLSASYFVALGAASLLVPLGAVMRMVARARVRAGFRDPLENMRRFMSRTGPRWALTATPALGWLALSLRTVGLFARHIDAYGHATDSFAMVAPVMALPLGVAFIFHLRFAAKGLHALVAPTVAADETQTATADGFSFDAVAVTKETVGAVGGLAALSTIMAALALALPTTTLMRSPTFFAAVIGYVAVAVGGALLFRRASRISVGLDGVFVSGSARRQFVPFSEIDNARANGSSIELTRGDNVVLRLQLHGADANRRDALAERIRDAITIAAAHRSLPEVDFVRSANQGALERAADGAASYREAAPSRDKLWDVLESPAVDTEGRKAAASALVRASDESERVRLRVAAEHCAEPSVRARIYELLEDDETPELALPRKARA